jgi:hypothetical protein
MTSVQAPGFEDIGLLAHHDRLYAVSVRPTSVLPAASFGFHLAMDTLAANSSPCRACIGLQPTSQCALPGAPKKSSES